MHRHRRSSEFPRDWPATLRRVFKAAEGECPRGHAEALRDLTTLALRKVPARGIFDPGARDEEELFVAIEDVARAHLELTPARNAWREALEGSGLSLEQRDALERSALGAQSVSDTAYFYAGLAFGLVFMCFADSSEAGRSTSSRG